MRRFWLAMLLLICVIGALPSSRAALLWHLRARYGQNSPALFVRRALIGEDVQPVRGPFPLDLERLSLDRDGHVARSLYAPPDDEQNARWKGLERRFPRDAVILALDLGIEARKRRTWRPVYGSPEAGTQAPSSAASATHFLELARRGEKLEPRNAFWSWMQLSALLALDREGETAEVLARSAGKTEYNDHVWQGVSAITRARRRFDGRVSTFEQLWLAGDALYAAPQLERETTRALIEAAWKSRVKAHALYREVELVRMSELLALCRTMYYCAPSRVSALTGVGMERDVLWSGSLAITSVKRPRRSAPVESYARDFRSLAFWAKHANRPDTEAAAKSAWEQLSARAKHPPQNPRFWSGIDPNAALGSALCEKIADNWLAAWPSTLLVLLLLVGLERRWVDGSPRFAIRKKNRAALPSVNKPKEVSPLKLRARDAWPGALGVVALSAPLPLFLGLLLLQAHYDPTLFMSVLLGGFGLDVPTAWVFHALPLLLLLVAAWSAGLRDAAHPVRTLPARLKPVWEARDPGAALSLIAWLSYGFAALAMPFLYLSFPFVAPLGQFETVPVHRFPLMALGVCFLFAFVPALWCVSGETRAHFYSLSKRWLSAHLLATLVWLLLLWNATAPVQARFDREFERALETGRLERKAQGTAF